MQVSVIRVGNSKGIRISKSILQQYGINEDDMLEMDLEEDKIVLRPTPKNPRAGWSEQFKQAIANGDKPEGDLFGGVSNKFDEEEWTW